MFFFRPERNEAPEQETATLSPELLARIKAIQIRTQRLVTDALAGEYHSAFKGRGMEFEQVREYAPGDDIRHIDWNVTARMSSPFVKEHREERELTVMLIVDVSSSGAFGTSGKQKREVVAELAAVLAYLAIQNNDRVGMIIFSDRIERFIPPKKGRAHVWRVIREVLGFRPTGRGTDLDGALEYLGRVVRRRSVGFVISDFLDTGFAERLRVAARRHDLTAIRVLDQREVSLPRMGLIELEDAETGETLVIDTADRRVSESFVRLARQDMERRTEQFRQAGVTSALATRPRCACPRCCMEVPSRAAGAFRSWSAWLTCHRLCLMPRASPCQRRCRGGQSCHCCAAMRWTGKRRSLCKSAKRRLGAPSAAGAGNMLCKRLTAAAGTTPTATAMSNRNCTTCLRTRKSWTIAPAAPPIAKSPKSCADG